MLQLLVPTPPWVFLSFFPRLVSSSYVSSDFPLLAVAAIYSPVFVCGPVCPGLFSPFLLSTFSCRSTAVCSPDIPPSPSVTTYISFRSLTGTEKAASLSWSLFLRAITLFRIKLLCRLQRYRGSKTDVGRIYMYMIHMRLANFIVTGTKPEIINGDKCRVLNCKEHVFKKLGKKYNTS